MLLTELMIIGSRQRLSVQCDDLEIRIDNQIIKRVDHTKSLCISFRCLIRLLGISSHWDN